MITYLHETGQLQKAFYTQTAPYHQGSRCAFKLASHCHPFKLCEQRLTALELQTLQIPSVMICDTMVGSLFQHHDIHAVGMNNSHLQLSPL